MVTGGSALNNMHIADGPHRTQGTLGVPSGIPQSPFNYSGGNGTRLPLGGAQRTQVADSTSPANKHALTRSEHDFVMSDR